MSLNRPVVLFFFNRPRHLERVFQRVREAKPTQLILVADRPGEAEACEDCRRVVSKIDWPCEVTQHYAEANMGCRDRIASGIRAVFEQHETAIFLEDDCLPRPSFFGYCDELLDRYATHDDIGFISGTRFIKLPEPTGDASYQFCQMPLVWGWASWRRIWAGYDEAMPNWPEHEDAIREKLRCATKTLGPTISNRVAQSVIGAFTNCYRKTLNTWDHPLAYHLLMQDIKCIIPRNNLVTNTGFGPLSTHTATIPSQADLRSADLTLPLHHPADTSIDPKLNTAVWKNCFLSPMLGEPAHIRMTHGIKRSIEKQVFKRLATG